MKQVTIKFDAVGNTQIEADGFVGNTCEDATKVFEDAFGGVEQGREQKPEYHQPVTDEDMLRF